jgi:hypothetical protein
LSILAQAAQCSFSEPFADRAKPEGGVDGVSYLALDIVALFILILISRDDHRRRPDDRRRPLTVNHGRTLKQPGGWKAAIQRAAPTHREQSTLCEDA